MITHVWKRSPETANSSQYHSDNLALNYLYRICHRQTEELTADLSGLVYTRPIVLLLS